MAFSDQKSSSATANTSSVDYNWTFDDDEYFDDEKAAKQFAKKHRKGYRIQEREEWNFAKAAYLRRGEDPKWITIYEDSTEDHD